MFLINMNKSKLHNILWTCREKKEKFINITITIITNAKIISERRRRSLNAPLKKKTHLSLGMFIRGTQWNNYKKESTQLKI